MAALIVDATKPNVMAETNRLRLILSESVGSMPFWHRLPWSLGLLAFRQCLETFADEILEIVVKC